MSTMTRGLSDQSEETHDGTGCVVVGVAVLLVAALIVAVVAWRSELDTRQARDAEIAALQTEIADLQKKIPNCAEYTKEADTINDLLKNHQYGAAAELANLTVARIPAPPCGELRTAYAGLAYQAAKLDLFETQKNLDGKAAEDRWRGIKERANVNGVPKNARIDPATICGEAYKNSWWELARGECLEHWNSKTEAPPAVEWKRFYYSLVRNFGRALVEREKTKTQGGALLHTACKIDRGFDFKQGEACFDLTQFFGADESKWPPPDVTDPVYQAAMALTK